MSSKQDKIPNDFASKLKNYEEIEAPDVWNEISIGVKKNLFYKFRWNHFNIYYLSVFSAFIIGIATLIIYKNDSIPTPEKNNQQIIINNSIVLDSIKTEELPQNKIKKTLNNNTTSASKVDSIMTDKIQLQENSIDEKKDTANVTPIIEYKKVEVSKPVVIVRKRDTIINIDTITVYKRKKKK